MLLFLKFVGGPWDGRSQKYLGKSPNGPLTWGVNASDKIGFYQRQSKSPDANGMVTMVWQPKDM